MGPGFGGFGGFGMRKGRKGRDVLTLPCIISRMVRVTLGLSVGERSREAILLE